MDVRMDTMGRWLHEFNDRFLAQEVVYPEDLLLFQNRPQPRVQFAGRLQVVAERLLHRDAGSCQQRSLGQVLHDRSEQRRRRTWCSAEGAGAAASGGSVIRNDHAREQT